MAGQQEAIEGGSRVPMSDDTTQVYQHGADARFATANGAPLDPREDFGEAFMNYMAAPRELLQASPEKFLFLDAQAGKYSPAQVKQMAAEAGVDLTQVVTGLLVSGRASQATIDRICSLHGLSADKVALLAQDQALLGKSTNLDQLVERLSLDIAVNGVATSKLMALGARLAAHYHALASRLPAAREADGLGSQNKVVSWLLGKAGVAGRLNADLTDARAAFQKLPLAVQLRTDPRLALGSSWFTLSASERAALLDPHSLQPLLARATDRAADVAYLPQQLGPTEKHVLANRTVLDALFDPSSQGAAFRDRLASGDVQRALSELRARNGERVWDLLPDAQKQSLRDPAALGALRAMATAPELHAALGVVRNGALGQEQVKAAMLRFQFDQARAPGDLADAVGGAVSEVQDARQQLFRELDASPLEVALTEVNRQVQERNLPFIQRFMGAQDERGLERALGPWVTQALSPSERRLLADPDYRRHLVENADQLRSTGASLADDARQYNLHTQRLQATLQALLQPDDAFRRAFARDPVGALSSRGLWLDLPAPVQQALSQPGQEPKLSTLVMAIQDALPGGPGQPVGQEARWENLRGAIAGINAGNYQPVLGLLRQSAPEIYRSVRAGVTAGLTGEARPRAGGPLQFI